MSYDLEIAVRVAGGEDDTYVTIKRPIYQSPTYNLGKMFRVAMGWDFRQGQYYNCEEVIPFIKHGITELMNHPEKYRQYEPKNKWGTVEGAARALISLINCIEETSDDYQILCRLLYVRW